ncbi:MAG: hypothetical protein ACLFPX_02980 [Candidatus Omnitrophota bacterium]
MPQTYEYTMGRELDLAAEQQKTLNTPCLEAHVIHKAMFWMMDVLYGKEVSWPKVKVLEILARYPYWAWEDGGYNGLSRLYARTTEPAEADVENFRNYISLGRDSQDNEELHMLIAEDIIAQKGINLGWFRHWLLPRLMGTGYAILTKIIFHLSPSLSFYMNAAFESHAEHEYMSLAADHPEWEDVPVDSKYFKYYPRQSSLNNLIRRIALDERDHMYHSLEEYEKLKH